MNVEPSLLPCHFHTPVALVHPYHLASLNVLATVCVNLIYAPAEGVALANTNRLPDWYWSALSPSTNC